MGLGNNSGKSTYVNIKDGKFLVKTGDKIEEYGYLTGMLTDLVIKDDKYKEETFKKLSLYMTDGDERFILDMKVGSGYWTGFCMRIPNADLTKPLTLIPSLKTENGKERRTMFINQGGPSLKQFWTKDNPGQLPALKQVEFQGKKLWDTMAQNNYLIEYLIYQVKPNLSHPAVSGPSSDLNRGSGAPAAGSGLGSGGPKTADDITEPIDDLPF